MIALRSKGSRGVGRGRNERNKRVSLHERNKLPAATLVDVAVDVS
jgi:hypothetical protein